MTKALELLTEDIELFRQAVGPIKRFCANTAVLDRPRPEPIPKQSYLQTQQVIRDMLSGLYEASEIETGDELLFMQPGLEFEVLRKLRRGQFAIEAHLDLHGMTVPVAKEALSNFLRECQKTRRHCVLIIHGKGNGSLQKRPILKGKLDSWLQQRGEVLAFCSARPVDGGTGAIYVLLRRL